MRELRAERGLTYDEVAERSGLARRTVVAMERGTRNGNIRSWFRIAQALGVPLTALVGVLDQD